jgi:hypothetical protein
MEAAQPLVLASGAGDGSRQAIGRPRSAACSAPP